MAIKKNVTTKKNMCSGGTLSPPQSTIIKRERDVSNNCQHDPLSKYSFFP
jgi:hypothetical protein